MKQLTKMIGSLTAKFAALLLTFGLVGSAWGANEAKIGTTEYATLDDAISAVGVDGTVVLLGDVTTSSAIQADKDFTLDLNNHKLTGTGDAVISVGTASLSVKDGTIIGDDYGIVSGSSSAVIALDNVTITAASAALDLYDYGGKVLAVGCSLTATDKNAAAIDAGGQFAEVSVEDSTVRVTNTRKTVAIDAGDNSTVSIIRSSVLGASKDDNEAVSVGTGTLTIMENCQVFGLLEGVAGHLLLKGGKYTDDPASYCADPSYIKEANTDATTLAAGYGYQIGGPYEAKIGTDYYSTLAASVIAAEAYSTPVEITVLKSVELSSTINITKGMTINLSGNAITATDARAIFVKSGDVTITGAGTISATKSESGTFDPSSSVIRVGDSAANTAKAKLTVGEDVTVASDHCYGITVFGVNDTDSNKATSDIELVLNGKVAVTGTASAISGNGTSTLSATTITIGSTAVVSATQDYAIYHPGKGTLTVNGSVTGKGGIEMKGGNVTINSGAVVAATAQEQSHSAYNNGASTSGYAIAAVSNTSYAGEPTVTISGGTITGKVIILADNDAENTGVITAMVDTITADTDFKWVADGQGYKLVEKVYVAQLYTGETAGAKYESIQDAINAAEDGQTVKLLVDVTTTAQIVVEGKELTLDLDGRTLTEDVDDAIFVNQGGSLTVTGRGTVVAGVATAFLNKGVLVIQNGTVRGSAENAILISNQGGSLDINGGTFILDVVSGNGGIVIENDSGTATITDAIIDSQAANKAIGVWTSDSPAVTTIEANTTISVVGSDSVAVFTYTGADTQITGGTISAQGHEAAAVQIMGTGTTTITGGTIAGTGDDSTAAVLNYGSGTIELSGDANISAPSGSWALYSASTGQILVEGGKVEGTIEETKADTIVVSGGLFSAVVPQDLCADGYSSSATQDSDGYYTVVPPVAQIGDAKFKSLAEAIAAANDGDTITLLLSTEEAVRTTIPKGKTLTLKGATPETAFRGQLMVTGVLNVSDITIQTPRAAIGSPSQFQYSAIDLQNEGTVNCSGVTFDMSAPGNTSATAITAWWSNGQGTHINVENCVFNCAGNRPIRSDASVTLANSTINDPYRYVIQMTSKSSTMDADADAVVVFTGNTIKAGTTSDKPVYGVQLEGATYGCGNLVIRGSDNTVDLGESGRTSELYFAANTDKVKFATIGWATEAVPVLEGGTFAAKIAKDGQTYYFPTLAEAVVEAEANGTVEMMRASDESITVGKALTVTRTAEKFTAAATAGEGYFLNTTDEAYVFFTGAVAKIGDTYYTTFADAIAAYQDGDEIVVIDTNALLDNPDWKIVTEEDVHKLVRKVYVAQVGENKFETIEEAVLAAQAGDTVQIIKAGDYTLPNLPQNITIEGAVEGVEFSHTTAGSVASIPNGATFKNVTFNFGNVNYNGFQHAGPITMEGCTLNGRLTSYGDMTFTNNCTFNQSNSDYHMWAYAGNLTYTGCTFVNEKTGKFINVYNESGATHYDVVVDDCKFINNGSSSKAALNVKATCGKKPLDYTVYVSNSNVEGAFPGVSDGTSLKVYSALVQIDGIDSDVNSKITVSESPDTVVIENNQFKGGTFDMVYAGSVAEGYVTVPNAQNKQLVDVVPIADAVAKIVRGEGSEEKVDYYASLKDAVEAAKADDTVTLLANTNEREIGVSKKITIDLNGKTVTSTATLGKQQDVPTVFEVTEGGDLTITGNGTVAGPANGEKWDSKALVTVDAGNLTIENGTFTATGSGSDGMYGVYISNGGTATFGKEGVEGGPAITSHFAAIGTNNTTAPATITVYGGTYTANAAPTSNDWWSYFCAPVYAASNGTYDLKAGTFNGYYGISSRYANVNQQIVLGGVELNGSSGTQVFVDEKIGAANDSVSRAITSTVTLTIPESYLWVKEGDVFKIYPAVEVTFNADNGTEATTVKIQKGAKATKPTDPVKEATSAAVYTFEGWFAPGATAAFDFNTAVEANLTLTARYTSVAPVAKIGDGEGAQYFAPLQSALDAAHEMTGDVTVTLVADITEVAVIHQKAGLNLTLDGAGKTITGQIYIDGDGRIEGTDTLTIKNAKFAYDASTYDEAFIYVPSTKTAGKPYTTGKYNYAHKVTVSNCEFAGSGETTVAFRVGSGAGAKGVVLNGLKAEGGHSFAQLTGVTNLTITDCTITGTKNGINISGGGGTGTISGTKLTNTIIDASTGETGYTLRLKDGSSMAVTLAENTFSGDEGIINTATGGKITVNSGKYAGPLPTDKTKFMVTGGLFSIAPAVDVCAEGLYPVNNTDEATKADYPYTVGNNAVAKWDDKYYTTLQAALDAVKAANTAEATTIDLLADASIEISQTGNVLGGAAATKITINGNNKKLNVVRNGTWAQFNTANNAKLVLNGVNLTSEFTGTATGWATEMGQNPNHNIAFNCDVELKDVNSVNALSFWQDASLDTVEIKETVDVYSIWIHTTADRVSIKNLTVDTTAGRGIKVDDSFVGGWGGTPSDSTTIAVNGATFKTNNKKSAILVRSVKPVDITTAPEGTIDISGVAADTTHLVWVDEDASTKFGLVKLNNEQTDLVPERSVADYAASLSANGTWIDGYYKTFVAAVAARSSYNDIITLLADVPDAYTLAADETLKVAKNGKTIMVNSPAEGLFVVESTADGVTTYSLDGAAAKIGEMFYHTLSDALAAANTAGTATTIKIIKNIEEVMTVVDVTPHVTFTADEAFTVKVREPAEVLNGVARRRFYFRGGATFEQNVAWNAGDRYDNGSFETRGFVTEFNGDTTINSDTRFRMFRIVGNGVKATVSTTGRLICDSEVLICVYDGATLEVNGTGSTMENEQIHGTIKIDNDSAEARTNTVILNDTYARLSQLTVKAKDGTDNKVEDTLVFTATNSRIVEVQSGVNFGDSASTVLTLTNSTFTQTSGKGFALAAGQTLNLKASTLSTTGTWTNNGKVVVDMDGVTDDKLPLTVVTATGAVPVPGNFEFESGSYAAVVNNTAKTIDIIKVNANAGFSTTQEVLQGIYEASNYTATQVDIGLDYNPTAAQDPANTYTVKPQAVSNGTPAKTVDLANEQLVIPEGGKIAVTLRVPAATASNGDVVKVTHKSADTSIADEYFYPTVAAQKVTVEVTHFSTFTIEAAVAKVVRGESTTYYATLQDAVYAAQAGDTVTLLKNIDLPAQVVVGEGKNVTIDLAGNTIFNTADIWSDSGWSLISVQGGTLTLKDSSTDGTGKLDAKADDCYALDVRDGGKLTVESGTYVGNITAVYVHDGEVAITGGKFDIKQLADNADDKYRFLVNCLDANYKNGTSKVTITGGTFHNFDPADNQAEGVETRFTPNGYVGGTADDEGFIPVIEGYIVQFFEEDGTTRLAKYEIAKDGPVAFSGTVPDKPTTAANTYTFAGWTVVGGDEAILTTLPVATADVSYKATYTATDNVARIGEGDNAQYFTTLQGAVDAATAGDTVTLLKDVTLASRVDVNKNLTIDLGGNTIKPQTTAANGSAFNITAGTVTIKNGTLDGTAVVESADGDVTIGDGICLVTVRSGATLNIPADTETETTTMVVNSKNGCCVYPFAGGTVNIAGGTFENKTTEAYQYKEGFKGLTVNQANAQSQLVNITGGTFKGNDPQLGDDSNGARFVAEGYVAMPAEGTTATQPGTYTVVKGGVVTFDADGGAPVPAEQRVAATDTAVVPSSVPTKPQFVFADWTLNGTVYKFTDKVTTDITLTATWLRDLSQAKITKIDGKNVPDEGTISFEYDGEVHGTELTIIWSDGTSDGSVTVNEADYDITYMQDVATQTPEGKENVYVGTVTVTAKAKTNSTTYTGATSATFEITQRPISVKIPTITEVYNGTTQKFSTNPTEEDVSGVDIETANKTSFAEGDEELFTKVYSFTVEGKDVSGSPYSAVSGFNVGGENFMEDLALFNRNYSWDGKITTGGLVIEPREVELAWGEKTTWEFDGAEHLPELTLAAAAADSDIGVISGDEVTAVWGDKQTNVGDYTATVTALSGAAAGNYKLPAEVTKAFSITPKAVTVTADAKTKVYGAADPKLTATVKGLVGSDTVAYTLGRAEGENVGPYTITPVGAAEQGNYSVAYETGTFTITGKPVTITAAGNEKTYDGQPLTEGGFTATALESGDTHTFTVVMSADSTITDVGTKDNVIATVDGTAVSADAPTAVGNYIVTIAKGELKVNPAKLTIEWTNTELTYNGNEQAPTATVKDLVEGQTLIATVSGGQKNVGDSYEATATLPDGTKNYTLDAATAKATFAIKPLAAVLAWDNTSFTYDGETHCPAASVENKIGSDEVTVTVEGATAAAGTHTATATALSNNNYTLSDGTTCEFTIGQLAMDLALTMDDWTVGNTASEPNLTGVQEKAAVTYEYFKGETSLGSTRPDTAGEYSVTATVTDTANYKGGTVSDTFKVSAAIASITKGEPAAITYYASIAEAVAAAADGDTVKVEDNVTLDARVDVDKSVTIDLNGKTVARTGTGGNGSAFDVKSGSVTIKNGTIDCTQDDAAIVADGVYAITARSGANVTLDGLTVTVNSQAGACVYPFDGAKMTILSGTYSNNTTEPYQYHDGWTGMAVNQANVATQLIEIKGGTFSKVNPALGDDSAAEGTMTFVADGYISVEEGGAFAVYEAVTATFKNGDETLETVKIKKGTTPAYSGETPTKEATAQYTYTFSGWDPALADINADATYTAQFDETVNKYTVKFVNEDGAVLQSAEVEYGTVPAYTGATPEKAATAEYTYTFKAWDVEPVAVTGEATYTATYTETKNKYLVTFKNDDGSTITSAEVEYGATPEAPAATKGATAQYTYTFKAWEPAVAAVTGEATYTATYDATVNKYTITFVDENGTTVLKTDEVEYGTMPTAPADPTKETDSANTYTFAGWTPAVAEVTGAATYKATYTSEGNVASVTIGDETSYYTSFAAALEAAQAAEGATIALLDNVTLDAMFDVTKSMTIDLNGKTLARNDGNSVVQVANGATLTIDGTVKGSAVAGRINVGTANNNNGNVVLNGGAYTCAEGNTVLHVNGTCTDSDVTIKNATIVSPDDNGIQLNGAGTHTIKNSTIKGKTAVYVKAGEVTITGSALESTATAHSDYNYNGNGSNPTGDAIVVDSCAYPGGNPSVALGEGTTLKVVEGSGNAQVGYYEANTEKEGYESGVVEALSSELTVPEGYGWQETNTEGVYALAKVFTVTFNPDNGAEATEVEVFDGEKVSAPETAPVKEGYTFSAWLDEDGNAFDFANTAITADVTLKAQWLHNIVASMITTPEAAIYSGEAWTVTVKDGETVLVEGTHYTVKYDDDDNVNAGTVTATVTGIAAGGYAGEATVEFEIEARPLVLRGGSDTVTYDGETHDVNAYEIDTEAGMALVEADTDLLASVVTGYLASGKDVGSYPGDFAFNYNAAGFQTLVSNYDLSTVSGMLTINRAEVNVAVGNAGKNYGEADPANWDGVAVTVTGLVGSDTVEYTVSRQQGENVGTYELRATGAREQGNYVVTFEPPGVFTIKAKTVTVTAAAASKTYGDADPALTATVEGLKEGDALAYTVTRAEGENVTADGYAITVTGAETQGNYTVEYKGAKFTINPAAVTVKADDKTKEYGDADPEFTATVSGLKNGDEPGVIAYNAPTCESGTALGTYPIAVTGDAAQGNYTVSYENGTLTVVKAVLSVTADDIEWIVGNKRPELTATATRSNGDVVTGKVMYSLLSQGAYVTEAGEYPIVFLSATATDSNYEVVTQGGTYTVIPSVAKIGDAAYYATLEDAFKAAAASGDTIELLTDVEVAETIKVEKDVGLNLGGFEIAADGIATVFEVGKTGALAIGGNGKVTGVANGQAFDGNALIMVDGGKLTVENGTFTATGSGSDGMYGVYVLNGGTAVFGTAEGGPAITSHFAAIGTNNTTAPAHITVNGGTFTANAAPTNNEWWSYFCAPVYAAAAGDFTLNGGTFNGYYGISSRYANVVQTVTLGNVAINATSDTQVFVDEKTGSAGESARAVKSVSDELTVPEDFTWVETEEEGVYLLTRQYTVTFVDEDGETVLQSGKVAEGKTPEYTGETPAKEANAQYTYEFAGWTPEIAAVTGEATYKATYSETVNEYTITFVNEGGAELQSGKVKYGETPAYTGETPTKAATDEFTYTFAGWDKEIVAVTGEATYTATFDATKNEYTIKFVNDDGTELQSGKVKYGETPAYTGETPKKAATAQYTYTFDKWDGEIVAVTGDATYTATYTSTVNEYVVKFVNEDGTVLQSETLAYGVTPEYKGDTPAKEADEEKTYTFAGWNNEIASVTGETTYTATYTDAANVAAVTAGSETKYYTTLAAAMADAKAAGTATVKMLADAEIAEGFVVDTAITLDMNGKTLTGRCIELFSVTSTGDLTITGNGTVNGPANGADFDGKSLITVDGGKLTVENGTFTATGFGSDGMYGVYVMNGGTATFGKEDGTGPAITSHFAAIGTNNTTAPAHITVNGGTYTAYAAPTNNEWWSYFCAPVYAAAAGDFTLNGGTFNGYYGISSRYVNVDQDVKLGNVTIMATSGTQVFVDEKTGSAGLSDRVVLSSSNERTIPEGYTWVLTENEGEWELKKLYTITFVDEKGETIKTADFAKDTTAEKVAETVTKEDVTLPAGATGYTWTPAIEAVSSNATYTVSYVFGNGFVYPVGNGGVLIKTDWIQSNVHLDVSAAQPGSDEYTAAVTALSAKAPNGIPYWQNYVLGLDPAKAQKLVIDYAAVENVEEVVEGEKVVTYFYQILGVFSPVAADPQWTLKTGSTLSDGTRLATEGYSVNANYRLVYRDENGKWQYASDSKVPVTNGKNGTTPILTAEMESVAFKTLAIVIDVTVDPE